jgi:hypothetical protein
MPAMLLHHHQESIAPRGALLRSALCHGHCRIPATPVFP